MTLRIIVSGGGIAGLTLAHLLARDGHDVVVLERLPDFSAGGHVIGFRGAGLRVMEHLGLREAVAQHNIPRETARFLTPAGRLLRTGAIEDASEAVGGMVMTRRALVHQVLREALPSSVEILHSKDMVNVHQDADQVAVTLLDGAELRGHLLIGADGVGSRTRELVMPELKVKDFGGSYAGLVIDVDHDFPLETVDTYLGVGRSTIVMPWGPGRVSLALYQDDLHEPLPSSRHGAEWREYLTQAYVEHQPGLQRVFAAIGDDDEVFSDRIRQVPAGAASKARVALVGDAAHCPTFMAGNGSALAVQDAYCLAAMLKSQPTLEGALSEYSDRMRPVALGYQRSADKARTALFTRNPVALAARTAALRLAPAGLAKREARKFYHGERTLADLS